jgi:hypothetical protein
VSGTAVEADAHCVGGAMVGQEQGVSTTVLLNGKGASANFDGTECGPAGPRGKCDGETGLNWGKPQMSAVSPPKRRTTAAVAQNPMRG